jgi:hypothetical protein
VYYDNMIVCGIVRHDLEPAEMAGLLEIEALHAAGLIKRVTSHESFREQSKTRDPIVKAALEAGQGELSAVPFDAALLGNNFVQDQYGGFVSSPMLDDIIDRPLYDELRALGFTNEDARHFMYAAAPENNCQYFLTTDPMFFLHRARLAALRPLIRVMRPTEFMTEWRAQQAPSPPLADPQTQVFEDQSPHRDQSPQQRD